MGDRSLWFALDKRGRPFACSHDVPGAEDFVREACLDKRGSTYDRYHGEFAERLMRKFQDECRKPSKPLPQG